MDMKFLAQTTILGIGLFLTITTLIYFVGIPQLSDATILDNQTTIKAGLEETCLSPGYKVECQKGLVCVNLTSDNIYYQQGICQYSN